MSEQPHGPGWWLASDGRYYPPQDSPGAVATAQRSPAIPYAMAGPSVPPRPLWKRWWFWLVLALPVVLCVVMVAWLVLGSAATVTLSPVKTVDYTSQPDGQVYVAGHVSSQVKDGALVLTHTQAGPMYLTIDDLGPTDNVGFAAVSGWSKDSPAASVLTHVGVLVLNADVEGYAATCTPDGTGQVWSVGVRETELLGTVAGAGCTSTNDLRIEVTRGMSGDIVGVTFPDGEKSAYLPGSSKAPFVGVGLVSLATDESAAPPPVLVSRYTVLLPE